MSDRNDVALHVLVSQSRDRCRKKREAATTARRTPLPEITPQLPELLPGHASPDPAHVHQPKHAHAQKQHAALGTINSTEQRQNGLDERANNTAQQRYHTGPGPICSEATFSGRAEHALPAPQCLRCGVRQSQNVPECKFHPALLKNPGPLLYSPEWHACRAAEHGSAEPGCYVRQGHYFPGVAVQEQGLVKASAVRRMSGGVGTSEQPRSQLPKPLTKMMGSNRMS